jgi:hypothetical protein
LAEMAKSIASNKFETSFLMADCGWPVSAH